MVDPGTKSPPPASGHTKPVGQWRLSVSGVGIERGPRIGAEGGSCVFSHVICWSKNGSLGVRRKSNRRLSGAVIRISIILRFINSSVFHVYIVGFSGKNGPGKVAESQTKYFHPKWTSFSFTWVISISTCTWNSAATQCHLTDSDQRGSISKSRICSTRE